MNQNLDKMIERCDEVAGVLKSLSHPVRLTILCQLMDDEKTVGQLTEFCQISQSAMSQFLIRMRTEGVLNSRKEGTSVFYSIQSKEMKKLIHSLKEIYCK